MARAYSYDLHVCVLDAVGAGLSQPGRGPALSSRRRYGDPLDRACDDDGRDAGSA